MSKPAKSKIRNRDEKPMTGNKAGAGGRTWEQRLASYRRSREQDNPLRGLTLRRAIRLTEDYFRGDMAELQWTYFHIEGSDEDMIALIELTLARLQEMDWDVVASAKADKKVAEAQIEFLRERFDGIDNLYEAIDHLALARFRGFSHCEKWMTDGVCTHLEIVDQWNTVRDGLKGAFKYNPEGKPTTFAAVADEMLMPPERFLFREVARPINRIALRKFVRYSLSDKDWDAYAEIYNIPSGVVTGPPDVPEEKEAEYEAAAKTIAEGGSGYLPHGATYIQNKAPAGGAPFKERLDHLSEKLILAGTGGMLTMLTDATGLGSGASEAHTKTFESIASAEAQRISEVINRQLTKLWLEEKFPGQKQVAYFRLAAEEEEDTSATIADVKTLFEAGFDLDEAEVTERTGWTVTKKAAPAPTAPGDLDPVTGKPITNRAGAGTLLERLNDITFAESTAADLAAATRKDQAEILKLLAALDATTSDADWVEAAREIDAKWPGLLAAWVKAGAKPAVMSDVNGTAVVSGMIEGARTRRTGPVKNRKNARTRPKTRTTR